MPIWIFLAFTFSQPAFAERALERLCFDSELSAQNAKPILNTVLVKGQDEIIQEGPCLNVFVEEKRGELLERWVNTRLPNAKSTFSTRNAPTAMCEMDLKKTTMREEVITNYDASGRMIGAQAGKDVFEGEENSTLKTSSGKPAMLLVDQNQLEVTCTKKTDDRYTISIAIKTLPQTVANFANPSQPIEVPPKNASSLQTEIEVGIGEEINLGQVVKDLKKDSIEASTSSGITQIRQLGVEKNTWILKVK